MGYIIKEVPCPECRKKGNDKSGDNLKLYNDGGAFCFACGYVVKTEGYVPPTEEEKEREKERMLKDLMEECITAEQNEALKSITGFTSYRGVREEIHQLFGVRFKFDGETGEPIEQFYPQTLNGTLCGYKVRGLPKDFSRGPIGINSKHSDLFGQFRASKCDKRTILLVGGEIDQLSAYQMLVDYQKDYQRRKGGATKYDPTLVVCSSIGEGTAFRQAQLQYAFLNQYEKIVVAMDNDGPGQEALEKLIPILPRGKVWIMPMRYKDPNEYLTKGKESEFISDWFQAKQFMPKGIISSVELYEKVLEHASIEKIPLPPFMKKVEDMLAGGFPLGYIINLGAISGGGKTSFVNECIYYWAFHSPHKVGVISCELNAGQYGEVMLSRHIKNKIALIKSPQEKMDFLMQESVREKARDLFETADGMPRWHLVDDRDGTLDSFKKTVEQLIIELGCKVIVVDPVQDVTDGMSNEEQALFMKWQKSLIKTHNVTFINISHVRKNHGGGGSPDKIVFITEEDFSGSSTLFKSAGCNILLTRNKYAEDPIEQNTTFIFCSKNRWAGTTGKAGEFYYENATHTLHDFEDYFGSTAEMYLAARKTKEELDGK